MERTSKMRLRLAASALVCSAVIATASAQSPADPLQDYDGKYRRSSTLKKIAARLEENRRAALQSVAERLGLQPKDPTRIRIELRDALPDDSEVIRPFTEPHFQTMASGDNVLIVLHTEFMVNGRFDVGPELIHEITHAVMRERMTPESYRGVPRWLREGLAVWTADQIEDKALAVVAWRDYLDDPAPAFPGLDQDRDSLLRYAEYGFAIEWIAREHGAAKVTDLARLLVENTAATAALKRVTGLAWPEFQAAAHRHALARIRELRPPETDEYAEISRLDRARRYEAVEAACDAFLRAHRKSPLRGDVLYFLGKACRLQRKSSKAERSLRELLRRYKASAYAEKALYQLGAVLVEAGKHRPAMVPFQRLLRDHPDSTLQDRAVYNLALCRARTANKREALRLLDVFDRSFPNSSSRQKAADLRRSLQ
jgi:TolA-binding protein